MISNLTNPRAQRLLLIVAIFCLMVLCYYEPAYAQGRRSRASVSTEIWMYIRWAALGLLLMGSYLFSFNLLFPSLLRRGNWPNTSYGISWSVLFMLTTIFTVTLLGPDLLPQNFVLGTSRLVLYRLHLIIVGVGVALTIGPLLYFRSHR